MKKIIVLISFLLVGINIKAYQEKCLLTHGIIAPNPNDFPAYWHLRYEKGPRSCFIIFTDEEKQALLNQLKKFDNNLPASTSFVSTQNVLYKAQMGVQKGGGYAKLTVGQLKDKLLNPTYSAIEE